MARLYGETALAKPHSQGLFPPFFMTFLQFIYCYRFVFPRFQRLHFSYFSCWDPCVHRIKQNGADSKKRRFVNSIQECFYSNCSRVKFKQIFFIKFTWGHLHQIYNIYISTYRVVLSALGLVKNKKVVFSKILKNNKKLI